MFTELCFDVAYAAFLIGCFCLVLAATEGIYLLLYRFVGPFRRMVDRFYDSLPEWEDEEGY